MAWIQCAAPIEQQMSGVDNMNYMTSLNANNGAMTMTAAQMTGAMSAVDASINGGAAFTAGQISLEREKQTLEMLTATPISSLAIVIGKLLSALAYVFLLIAAGLSAGGWWLTQQIEREKQAAIVPTAPEAEPLALPPAE